MYPVFSTMLLLEPNELIEMYFDIYLNLFGELKSKEIADKINDSQKVNDYLNNLKISGKSPSAVEIGGLLMSIRSLLFAKPETICLSGLFLLLKWNNYRRYNDEMVYDPEEVSHICAEFINYCSKMKFNRTDSCFTRLFNQIASKSPTLVNQKSYIVIKGGEVQGNELGLMVYTLKSLGFDSKRVFYYTYNAHTINSYLRFDNSEFYEDEFVAKNGRSYKRLLKKFILSGKQDFVVKDIYKHIVKANKTLIRIVPKDFYAIDKYVVFYDTDSIVGDYITLDLNYYAVKDKYLYRNSSVEVGPQNILLKELYPLNDTLALSDAGS